MGSKHTMRCAIATLCFLASAAALPSPTNEVAGVDVSAAFKSFQSTYGKTYASEEEALQRRQIFESNLRKIEEHNSNPRWTYTLAVNQFADLTEKEFGKLFAKGIDHQPDPAYLAASTPRDTSKDVPVSSLPKSLDWRTKG